MVVGKNYKTNMKNLLGVIHMCIILSMVGFYELTHIHSYTYTFVYTNYTF